MPHVPIDHGFTPAGPTSSQPARAAELAGTARRAALVAVEPATRSLLSVWLAEHHWVVVDVDIDPQAASMPPRVIVVEASFPRVEAPPALSSLARQFPGVPMVVISPTIVAGTPVRGDVARKLGVAAVLAMPLSCAVLIDTIHELTGSG